MAYMLVDRHFSVRAARDLVRHCRISRLSPRRVIRPASCGPPITWS